MKIRCSWITRLWNNMSATKQIEVLLFGCTLVHPNPRVLWGGKLIIVSFPRQSTPIHVDGMNWSAVKQTLNEDGYLINDILDKWANQLQYCNGIIIKIYFTTLVGTKSDQQVNICSFVVRCDRRWTSTQWHRVYTGSGNVPYVQFGLVGDFIPTPRCSKFTVGLQTRRRKMGV